MRDKNENYKRDNPEDRNMSTFDSYKADIIIGTIGTTHDFVIFFKVNLTL